MNSQKDLSNEQLRNFPKTTNVGFRDSTFFQNLNNEKIKDYLRVIYLCHEIIVNKQEKE